MSTDHDCKQATCPFYAEHQANRRRTRTIVVLEQAKDQIDRAIEALKVSPGIGAFDLVEDAKACIDAAYADLTGRPRKS